MHINAKSQQGLSTGTDGSLPPKAAKIIVVDPFSQKANTFDLIKKQLDYKLPTEREGSIIKAQNKINPIGKSIHSIISKIICSTSQPKKKNLKKVKIRTFNELGR